jgi:stearoyl-CoA desaturase (Delta-9 desaturase)
MPCSALFIYAGSIAAIVWTIMQGIGWVEIAVFVGMYGLTMSGMGAGIDRLFVHRSFRCGPIMRTLFGAIATMAVQGSILKWVANQRRHHRGGYAMLLRAESAAAGSRTTHNE